jgi:reactive chlorine resistance protein C
MNQNRQMAEVIPVEGAARGTTACEAIAARWLLLGGEFVLRYSLVFFLLFFGALKWTAEEANGIQSWVEHSPLLFWLIRAFGLQGASEFIGVIELTIGILIASRHWSPRLSAIGSLAAIPMFVTTLSFLVTTPNVDEASGFLLKDLTLLGAAIWTAGEALQADSARVVG